MLETRLSALTVGRNTIRVKQEMQCRERGCLPTFSQQHEPHQPNCCMGAHYQLEEGSDITD